MNYGGLGEIMKPAASPTSAAETTTEWRYAK